SSIYYKGKDTTGRRKPRVPENIERRINELSAERTTYGYRRIWAMLRNSGTDVNIKTVRRIMNRNHLSLPYARHKTGQGEKISQSLMISTDYGKQTYIM
ncbi:orfB, partial [mine drainage metagenome]